MGDRRVGEHSESTGLSRRDVLKGSAVVGGLIWIAPTVLASPAGAGGVTCPPGSLYAVKHVAGQAACGTPGDDPSTDCAAAGGYTAFKNGCCLVTGGLITFEVTTEGSEKLHVYTLAAGVGFVEGFVRCGSICKSHDHTAHGCVVDELNDDGTTTVTFSCTDLVYSELFVCVSGTTVPNCP